MATVMTGFVEMHRGQVHLITESGKTEPLHPFFAASAFNDQRDFDSGCGFWHGEGMLVFKKEDAPRFPDKLAQALRAHDTRFITDRPPGEEVCRVTLPCFQLVLDDGSVLDVEVLANFFRSGHFDVVYVYRGLQIPLTLENLWRVCNWNAVKRIRLTRILVEVIGTEHPMDQLKDMKPDDYLETDFQAFCDHGFAEGKIDFLLQFMSRYILRKRPTVSEAVFEADPPKDVKFTKITQDYAFYSLETDSETIDQSELETVRRLLERRPEWYIFNENVAPALLEVSIHRGERIFVGPNYSFTLSQRADQDELRLYAREGAFLEIFMTVQYFLFEQARLVLALRELDRTPLESLSKKRLLDLRRSLLDLAVARASYSFSAVQASMLAMSLKRALELEDLERDFEKSCSKIEYLIEERQSDQNDSLNLRISIVAVLLSVPAVTEIIDLVAELIACPSWTDAGELLAMLGTAGGLFWGIGRQIQNGDASTQRRR